MKGRYLMSRLYAALAIGAVLAVLCSKHVTVAGAVTLPAYALILAIQAAAAAGLIWYAWRQLRPIQSVAGWRTA